MTPEKNIDHPAEAQRDLELAWIDRNTSIFSAKASGYFGLVGRGAIIVDSAPKPLSEGPLFTYFSKEQLEHIADADINEMVDGYNPEQEFIVLLLLSQNQTRAYRIDIPDKEKLLAGESDAVEYAGT
jgi:hypothetical protein